MKKKSIITAAALLLVCCCGSAQTLSLEECRRIASSGNSQIKNAELEVSAARAQKQEAMSLWFPSVSIKGVGFKTLDPLIQLELKDLLGSSDAAAHLNYYAELYGNMYGISTSWDILDHGFNASAVMMQPLYAGGRIHNGNRLASLGIKASEAKKALTQRETLDEVDKKYWQVVSLQDKMQTLDEALLMLENLSNDVVNAYEAGLALDTDTLKVAKERNKLLLDKMQLESGLRLAKTDLLNYIGYSTEHLDSLTLSGDMSSLLPPSTYYLDPQEIAAGTQESQLLSMQVEAAKLQKKMAIGEALPQVACGGAYGYGGVFGVPQWNGAVFATVNIPVTDWWKTGAKAKRLECEKQKAVNDRDYLNQQLELKADALWQKILINWGALEIAQDNVNLDEIAETRLHDLYDAGGATLSELLKAQVDLRSSRSALVDAQIAYRMAVTEYTALSE